MKGYVYILLSLKDKKQYIGSTIDIQKRLKQHDNGEVEATRNRRPLILKHVLEFDDIKIASQMEKKFKKSHSSLDREVKKRNSGISSDG